MTWRQVKTSTPSGQQVYALLDDEAGRVVLGTWAHFSTHGRPDTDIVYAYRVEYYGSHEATEPMVGVQARAFEQRLCGGQGALFGLADGQDTVPTVVARSGTRVNPDPSWVRSQLAP